MKLILQVAILLFVFFDFPAVSAEPRILPNTVAVEDVDTVSQKQSEPRSFKVCKITDPNKRNWGTSGDYMQELARCIYDNKEHSDQEAIRLSIIEDIYTKSWSYAWINKIAFWFSIFFGILIILWPTFVSVMRQDSDEGRELAYKSAGSPSKKQRENSLRKRVLTSATAQSAVAALAALSFAFYSYYKDKQAISENLMRTALYAEVLTPELQTEIFDRLLEMDKGFQFSSELNGE
ncbi:MAG: hypothetical protein QNJ29_07015 [Rhizobiaceae bacterium]|nr:hypothetical protein [Rhizobiaceae bacterium]